VRTRSAAPTCARGAGVVRPALAVAERVRRASGIDSLRGPTCRAPRAAPLARGGRRREPRGGGERVVAPGARSVARAEVAGARRDAWLSAGRVERGRACSRRRGLRGRRNAGRCPYRRRASAGSSARFAGASTATARDVNAVVWDYGGRRSARDTRAGRATAACTNWLRPFPDARVRRQHRRVDEYRSEMSAVFATPSRATARRSVSCGAPRRGTRSGALLELRLQSAVISFQIRNASAAARVRAVAHAPRR
jgi:hypothetical protein